MLLPHPSACNIPERAAWLGAQDALQQRRQPCIGSMDVGKDNMKRVIGSGGSTIKMLEASTRTKLVVAEGGIVHIYAPSAEKYNAVKAQIQGMTGASIEASTRPADVFAPIGTTCIVLPVLLTHPIPAHA